MNMDHIRQIESGWVVLKTSAGRTLALAGALAKAGVESYAPERIIRVRAPRSRRVVEHHKPILPMFVFVRAIHLRRLIDWEQDPLCPMPGFTVFRRWDDRAQVPVIADATLQGIRDEEEQARIAHLRKARQKRLAVGTTVRLTEGPWRGLTGTVEKSDERFAKVSIGGRHALKVATFMLIEDAPALNSHGGGARLEPVPA